MIFVDTGYFLALFSSSDQFHDRAKRWSRVVGPLLTTEYVFLEAINTFSAIPVRRRAMAIIQVLHRRNDLEVIEASRELWNAGIDLFVGRADKSWSLVDCISFDLMQRRGITQALAYDHHFEQAGFEALLRRDP